MSEEISDTATALANELKELIRNFEHRSFIGHIAHFSNIHVRQKRNEELLSPIRQLMYLISLYHSTEIGGKQIFYPEGESERRMMFLLNEIEKGYSSILSKNEITQLSKDSSNRLLVSTSTFLNYFLNASLTYMEQDIERVRRTFEFLEPYIIKETSLSLDDFISFFKLMTTIEKRKASEYLNNDFNNDPVFQSFKQRGNVDHLTAEEKLHLLDLGENAMYEMAIPLEEIYSALGEDKATLLLYHFTMIRKEDDFYLYYTDDCPYLRRPIILMDENHVTMVYSKQLINAIYEYLYELCDTSAAPGKKVSERRDLFLEDKTHEVFNDLFGPKAHSFRTYYADSNEKDLIFLYDRDIYIIECKAHKYRTPLRTPAKAYNRVKDDFNKSIGKGYEQAKEVEDLFYEGKPFDIYDKKKRKLTTIDPQDYDEVFTIIVTQERFGQIQCDLHYLLKIEDNQNYPWSVCIHDLETFLITLKRKRQYKKEFKEFLLAREKLQERLICYDELEICAYFLFDRDNFMKVCNRQEMLFSDPTLNLCFDLLYSVGFGFKDELDLEKKLKIRNVEAANFIKYHKLKPADRISDFWAKDKNSK